MDEEVRALKRFEFVEPMYEVAQRKANLEHTETGEVWEPRRRNLPKIIVAPHRQLRIANAFYGQVG